MPLSMSAHIGSSAVFDEGVNMPRNLRSLISNPSPSRHHSSVTKTTVRWRIFLLILLIVAINYVDRASLSVAMPTIGEEFGIDATAQGIILSSFFWTYALMQIPGGWLADRYRPRLIIASATILWGAFQALAALATG